MIKSMTGFSRAELQENGINVSVEIKSLNGKYLEINCRLSKSIQTKENEIREIIRKYINRGTVSININVETDLSKNSFKLNTDAAKLIYNQLENLRKDIKIKEPIKITDLMSLSSYFLENENNENLDKQFAIVKKVLNNALRNLDQMRKKEGQALLKDINNRMKFISEVIEKIEKLGIQRIPQEREKLKQKLAQFFENEEYDEQRLQMEILLMADKLDITEEIIRLRSHIKYYYEIIKNDENPGRKINFLLQEINREINTIGSKANDAQISQYVVNLKEELEKIREQIQNIE
jgi:uncharacterized protein (TIGR00255 family)